MNPWIRSIALGALLCVTCVSCLGQPIPRRVVAGTTLVLPFGFSGFESLFSSVPYGADPAINPGTLLSNDRQRGNFRFVLCTGVEPNCGTQRPLTLRYMTRVTPDRGSRIGRSGATERSIGGVTATAGVGGLKGQPFVVLDVPFDTPPRMYQLTYLLRRPGATTDQRVTLQQIEVVAGNGSNSFTDLTLALNDPDGGSTAPSLQGFIPDPQLTLVLLDPLNLEDRPAAASLVLRHPSSVQILGAFEDGVLGQGSVVRMSPGPSANTVSLLLVDPERQTVGLRVAFQLSTTATAPAMPTDFSIDSQTLYKLDGSLLPATTDPNGVGNSFGVGPIF